MRPIALCFCLWLCCLPAARAEVLLSENWNSGSIDPARWLVSNPAAVRLVNLGGTDHALALGNPGAWGDHIYSQAAFTRGDRLRCSFRIWRSVENAQVALHGPFHSSNTGPVYANLEAGVDYVVNNLRWGEAIPPNPIQSGPALDGLTQAIASADSKAVAVIVRVSLGDTQGALLEFSTNNGLSFITAIDTRGSGPSNRANVYLGFGAFDSQAGVTLIDDIVVERGNTPDPTPTPIPNLPERIQDLSHFFDDPQGTLGPWSFEPATNVQQLRLDEQQGYLMLFERGEGQEIKGLLPRPIKLSDYPLPWEFQTALMPNFDVLTGRSSDQVNTAMGINIAVTFSDPATWPEDRSTPPADLRSFQLLNVHLGNYAEVGTGLPQLVTNPNIYRMPSDQTPEAYLMVGRGTLGAGNPGQAVNGDWKVPYIWIGDGAKYGGPASSHIYFRCQVINAHTLAVGFKFDMSHGWNMRTINTQRFGAITGIWEIGPIFAVGDYIPQTLAPQLGITGSPAVKPPDPRFEYYLDYCAFLPAPPIPLEDYSDEFDIPGWMGKWQIQEQSTIVETWSKPGHATLTMVGPGLGTGIGPVGAPEFRLSNYPPPWELEWCFLVPDDSRPWNFEWVVVAYSPGNANYVIWKPGVENDPVNGLRYINGVGGSAFNLTFPEPVPQAILSAKPLRMLIQVISSTELRVGFKAREEDPWFFSNPYDVTQALPGGISKFQLGVFSTETGRRWLGRGGAAWQQLHIDYVRYRYGKTENSAGQSSNWKLYTDE